MNEDYLKTQQVADMMGCTVAYVALLAKRGLLPGARKLDPNRRNSALRIPRESVEKFMQSQLVVPQEESSSEN